MKSLPISKAVFLFPTQPIQTFQIAQSMTTEKMGLFSQTKVKVNSTIVIFSGNALASVFIQSNANPIFKKSLFHSGRGSLIIHDRGKGNFEECEIFQNEFAGIEIREKGNPFFERCKIYDGQSAGVFIYSKLALVP